MIDPVLLTPLPLTIVFAIFGLMIGSFLNVCIYRLPLNQSVVHPGSRCTKCGKEIQWYQNIPVLSWLVLRGRCGSCGDPISIIYPLIELATGALFALHFWWFGLDPILIPRLIFACALLVLALIDLRHRILPNPITLGGTVLGFLFSLVLPPGWAASLIGLLIGGGVLFLVGEVYFRLRGIEGMGMGDVKMLAMIGAFLGWKAVLVTIVLASISGAIIGMIMMIGRKGDMQYALPFGTFLSAAALVSSFVGDRLIDWYVAFTRL
jgi:leader peptidase (prepilin peptidase)/N-methyltransferase